MTKKEDAPLHSGHRERMRKMIETNGFSGMPDHMILEFFLYYALPRVDTNPIAHRLIDRFGSLQGVFDADKTELMRVEGIGERTALLLKSIPALNSKYSIEKVKRRDNYSSVAKAGKFLVDYYLSKNAEEVTALFLDNSGGLISFDSLHIGTVNSAPVTPRKIAELAFRYGASSLILAHNHPFGNAEPSKEDLNTTRRIVDAFIGLDLTMKAHIVVAGNKYKDVLPMMYDNLRFAPKYIVVESNVKSDGNGEENEDR